MVPVEAVQTLKERLIWVCELGYSDERNGGQFSRRCVSHLYAKVRHRRATAERLPILRIDSRSAVVLNESVFSFALPVKAPPFLFSFPSLEDYLSALSPSTRKQYEKQILKLCEQRLPPVASVRCLATLVGYSPKFMGVLNERTDEYYRTFHIRTGAKRRAIQAPKVALKVIQKWFGHHLAENISYPEAVFGFVKGRSAIQGAARHCSARWIYSIDIKDFFTSTPIEVVHKALAGCGYPEHGAGLISKLCTYGGALAQGSPASPVLSNLVFQRLDTELTAVAKRFNVRYTRYADDIVYSGLDIFPKELPTIVRQLVEDGGWKLATKKEHFASAPQRLKVYGLLVSGDRPRLTKGYRNRLRAFQHLLVSGGVRETDRSRLQGHVAYGQAVEAYDDEQKALTDIREGS